MFGKKLEKKDLIELIKRTELINQYVLIAQALELQKNVWLNGKLQKLGMDLAKQYEINFKNGEVKKVKEPIKNEPAGNQTNPK